MKAMGLSVASGISLAGVANGASGALIVNNTLLADNKNLNENERAARSAGRTASYVGGIAAGASSMAVVSGSAAGITSGLAALGGVVGGGMTAGAAILVAAPAAVAAVVGVGTWGTVKLVQWMFD
jgi:hypothetical protein